MKKNPDFREVAYDWEVLNDLVETVTRKFPEKEDTNKIEPIDMDAQLTNEGGE